MFLDKMHILCKADEGHILCLLLSSFTLCVCVFVLKYDTQEEQCDHAMVDGLEMDELGNHEDDLGTLSGDYELGE